MKLDYNKHIILKNNLHIDGDTLFIAGTTNKQDVWDDISKFHFGALLQKANDIKTHMTY